MNVSFQLYSVRNFPPWPDMIAALAGLGYTHVEGFGGVYEDAAGFRALLDEHGLAMPSGHFGLEALEDNLADTLDQARTLGIEKIYAPYLDADQRPQDADGWRAFAARLAHVGAQVRAAGFRFGWHNHDFEFAPLPDGAVPMRMMLEADPDLEWEADIAWIIRGGADPSAWIDEFGDRISAVHVKDIAPDGENTDEDGWADVGDGVVNWAALVQQLRASGVTLFVMEHDNPSNGLRFATTSIKSFLTY